MKLKLLTSIHASRYCLNDVQEIIFPQDEAVKKLTNYLKKQFPIGYIRKLFRKDGIRLNGQRAKPDELVRHGDRIQIFIPFERATKRSRKEAELAVIFEDDGLLVINKPPGIAVHEAKDILKLDTVLGMLEARYQKQGVTPRLVHRLDKNTSGVLVVGKTEQVVREMEVLFEAGNVDKEYLSLIVGLLPQNEGTIDFPLPGREAKTVGALTHFKAVKRFSETTLVRVNIETGRLHQIRLHFARLGYPVVMDERHGNFTFNKRFRKNFGLKRQFLHASRLALEYHGKKQTWSAPLPSDLDKTLKRLSSKTT